MIPLLVIIFGLIQYGLYFWAYQGGSDVARSAARLSAVGEPAGCDDFIEKIEKQVGSLAASAGSTEVTRTYDMSAPPNVQVGDTVTVTVKFTSVDLNFPYVPFIDDGVVTATALARVDYVPNPPEACS
jgi:Flp pilus assembly protein TadG